MGVPGAASASLFGGLFGGSFGVGSEVASGDRPGVTCAGIHGVTFVDGVPVVALVDISEVEYAGILGAIGVR